MIILGYTPLFRGTFKVIDNSQDDNFAILKEWEDFESRCLMETRYK